jgi:hypothetical protein
MSTITPAWPEKDLSVISRAVRYVFGTGQRRLLKEMRRREAWVRQAQTAPTVKAWTDSLDR